MGLPAGSWQNPFGSYHVGDVIDVLRTLPAESVQCVVTSPPYWALKDLVGIPWRVALALQADGWWLRSDIIWAKPNPMPESVTDRPTKSHEHVFLLTKRADYFYDATAIAEPAISAGEDRGGGKKYSDRSVDNGIGGAHNLATWGETGATRNARDVWTIATAPYAAAHFATYPPELVKRCILAGTSERGCCPTCGSPWEREVTKTINIADNNDNPRNVPGYKGMDASNGWAGFPRATVSHETTGWQPTCEHGETPVPCTVLDPFMGSGTTALVAQSLNRRWVGIDLSPEYAALAQDRCGTVTLQMALA